MELCGRLGLCAESAALSSLTAATGRWFFATNAFGGRGEALAESTDGKRRPLMLWIGDDAMLISVRGHRPPLRPS